MPNSYKKSQASHRGAKLYALRDSKTGQFVEVDIVRPKKAPTSVRLAAIRRAVRDTHAGRKAK